MSGSKEYCGTSTYKNDGKITVGTAQSVNAQPKKGKVFIMIIGRVTGSVVSTRKNERLIGSKFMIVQPVAGTGEGNGKMVAVDNVGAGIGEYVLVAVGSAARIGCDMSNAPVDAAIVGIIDDPSAIPDIE